MIELKSSFPDFGVQGNNPDTLKLLQGLWAFPFVMEPSVNTNKPFLEKSKLAEQSEGIWLSCWREKQKRFINRSPQKRTFLFITHYILSITCAFCVLNIYM
jgi:hypothetical protein